MHPQLLSVLTVFLTLLAGPLLCLPGVKCQQAASNTSAWNAPPGGDLALNNFKYQEGNTASLAGPQQYTTGLDKGQVTGIVVGCVLFGLLAGALGMLCWLKRKRLFPQKYGPCKHPGEAAAVGPIDVLRSGTKLDCLSKEELVSVKSFSGTAAGGPAGPGARVLPV